MNVQESSLSSQINDAVEIIRNQTALVPEIGIVLGTGLGGGLFIEFDRTTAIKLEDLITDTVISQQEIVIKKIIPYENIPHFPLSTVEFHSGNLLFGTISRKNVVAMQGRFHFYEGFTMHQITFPIRIMKALGVKVIIISNACGTMNPYFKKGEIMIIDDHINLLGTNPLIGINDDSLGGRFPDMSEPYSKRLIEIVEKIGIENGMTLFKGVYAAMTGPSLETRAEYRFLRTIGADVVGMSTVPEVIVARQMNMEVLGLAVITDECFPESLKPVDIETILRVASIAEPKLTLIIRELMKRL